MAVYSMRIQRSDGQTAVVRGIRSANDGDFWMDVNDWSSEVYDALTTGDIVDLGYKMDARKGEAVMMTPAEVLEWLGRSE